ncbi:carnosine N-methyltransferase [Neodiprion pinetum]|uniref:Carnosine N-methyltransferase n=1 Tax=Neodiprion lecontei TaxID=441921 RepID=A0A6J0C8Y4_NEOLC|nr:carnosine N-methyltransferase [Neodiprion lecontei]XP_046422773.1 carnosine N-methyltransferase [Neodiprion fabricii]XP_046480600.1 carnosine N-methyltransferase [Neodiprion pinetum]XP_046617951.1 carnosine N-methyltransferase [Neodiprion virginianus]
MDTSPNSYSRKMHNSYEDEEERMHFLRIVSAFKYYRPHSLQRVKKTETYFMSLPGHHQKLLSKYREQLQEIKRCIENNDHIIKLIIKDVTHIFENVSPTTAQTESTPNPRPVMADQEKVQATIKQLVRDWSEEGAQERLSCYQPIIDEILQQFPPDFCVPSEVQVLVPGAGLGRLAYEIARRGYTCQGNEFSLFMLFASHFVLNKCRGTNTYQVHPWVHQYMNNLKPEHQTHAVLFPDVNPSDLPENAQFSMAAGDFLEVYTEDNHWDCVATCFFIDCANNVVQFIETIYKILKPGGVWINLGPLLYHFSDIPMEDSIEPSYEAVREVIMGLGFRMEREDTHVKTRYAQNTNSMLQYEYNSVYFVCRKPKANSSSDLSNHINGSESNGSQEQEN